MDKIIEVWTVIPNDFELSTQHFETQAEAVNWAKTYHDGAQVFKQELPERIVNDKRTRTAKYGYRL